MPLRWSQAIGAFLGVIIVKMNKKRKHIIECNLQACFPNKTKEEQQQLVKATAAENGKWVMETAHVWFGNPRKLKDCLSIKNPDLLEQAYHSGKGVLIVLPHLGNWEMLNVYIPQLYSGCASMYKPFASAMVEMIVSQQRKRVGTCMFGTDIKGVRQAFKHLKKGNILAILSDHLPSRKAGVYAPFFGLPALTGKLTHSLARYNQSEILLATVIRQPKGQGFEIEFSAINGLQTEDAIEAATHLNATIEKAILKAPEQYQWGYTRFNKQPKGIDTIYSKNHR